MSAPNVCKETTTRHVHNNPSHIITITQSRVSVTHITIGIAAKSAQNINEITLSWVDQVKYIFMGVDVKQWSVCPTNKGEISKGGAYWWWNIYKGRDKSGVLTKCLPSSGNYLCDGQTFKSSTCLLYTSRCV